jgi:MFS transporter, PHS family, inorganic phosphate transporter
VILKAVDSTASLEAKLLWTLGIFVVFAVPGYIMAVLTMDRIGHRRLQFIGFAVMAVAFLTLAAFKGLTTMVVPFLAIFGFSYFFVEFGPNVTTFVLPSEVFPVSVRTTGHGIAAGVGKLGAFLGVFFVPQLETHFGLRGMLTVSGVAAILGFSLTRVLPEPARRNLEDMNLDPVQAVVAASLPVDEHTEVPSILDRVEPPSGGLLAAVSDEPATAPSHATG